MEKKEEKPEPGNKETKEKTILRIRIDEFIFDLNELMEEEHRPLTLDNFKALLVEQDRWIEQERKIREPLPPV